MHKVEKRTMSSTRFFFNYTSKKSILNLFFFHGPQIQTLGGPQAEDSNFGRAATHLQKDLKKLK